VTWLVSFTSGEAASALVSVAVVGREPRVEADVVVKDGEAWVPSSPTNFTPTFEQPPTGVPQPVDRPGGRQVADQ
jgi:hypothetical protein